MMKCFLHDTYINSHCPLNRPAYYFFQMPCKPCLLNRPAYNSVIYGNSLIQKNDTFPDLSTPTLFDPKMLRSSLIVFAFCLCTFQLSSGNFLKIQSQNGNKNFNKIKVCLSFVVFSPRHVSFSFTFLLVDSRCCRKNESNCAINNKNNNNTGTTYNSRLVLRFRMLL